MFKNKKGPQGKGPKTGKGLSNCNNPEELTSGYGKYAYKWIINERMNILRSRLLNLADSITSDEKQREATKGLIKDFCGEAYYPMLSKLEDYLEFFKVIEANKNEVEMPPRLSDTANRIKD